MRTEQYLFIDFDSTFISSETLDELAKITLADHPKREIITQKIAEITRLGMEGKLPFNKSLEKRMRLLSPKKHHIDRLTKVLKTQITASVRRNKMFFRQNAGRIYIISGGFKEIIAPIVQEYGIAENHILANNFVYDRKGEISGYDSKNPLAQKNGKVKAARRLKLSGDITVIGDGYTDYQMKALGVANRFVALTENVFRESVATKADEVIATFDDFLYEAKNSDTYSYPKAKIQVVLLENIDNLAVKLFEKEGYQVSYYEKSLSEDELGPRLAEAHILGIRSRTYVTPSLLRQAQRLLSIGAYCIGTNQIDLTETSRRGIAAFNAPYSNTRSVVELVIGEILMLIRAIPEKNNEMHRGVWHKSAKGQNEVRGKTIGIVGYGNIGSQLSVIAEALGMQVLFYDKVEKLALGNAKRCRTLVELLKKSDIVTLHIDGSPDNKNFITDRQFRLMKTGVIFLNLSRGFVVDIPSLVKHIKTGKIRGAAVDVFPKEPKGADEPFVSQLQNLPNVILTPHIGGSTLEAQHNIAEFVTGKIIDFINNNNRVLVGNYCRQNCNDLCNACAT